VFRKVREEALQPDVLRGSCCIVTNRPCIAQINNLHHILSALSLSNLNCPHCYLQSPCNQVSVLASKRQAEAMVVGLSSKGRMASTKLSGTVSCRRVQARRSAVQVRAEKVRSNVSCKVVWHKRPCGVIITRISVEMIVRNIIQLPAGRGYRSRHHQLCRGGHGGWSADHRDQC
jgi:hypothetical protein